MRRITSTPPDFNFTPDDCGYSLLVGDELNSEQRDRLQISRVVHVSIDPTVPLTAAGAPADDESEAVDPDRVITNARSAVPADGLLSDSELVSLFSSANIVRSAYDEGLRQHKQHTPDFKTFGDRVSLPPGTKGSHEPEYTRYDGSPLFTPLTRILTCISYTHYWKVDLDLYQTPSY
jgi:RNA exonuclease NGL2